MMKQVTEALVLRGSVRPWRVHGLDVDFDYAYVCSLTEL